MKKVALLLAAATVLSACGHSAPPPPGPTPGPSGPPRPPVSRDTVTPAIDMCEVATLAEQRLAMLEEVHGYREAILARPGHRSGAADTETQELIAAFETDLDASYRFATASCRTYNRCLQENRFDEASCQDTAALWHDGQDRFHDLSERLALVRERIAHGCHDCEMPGAHSRGDPDHDRRRHRHGDEDDLMGSVFSTGDRR
ncbi:hypothetical protein [Maricaulis sp.]|uniref:hypothetical protein n=1 Tax=Maricaulis sp. TaxID=1486257 RepID=UPI002607FCD9|nr:hypothetical protein [Maricaulis sp.]